MATIKQHYANHEYVHAHTTSSKTLNFSVLYQILIEKLSYRICLIMK